MGDAAHRARSLEAAQSLSLVAVGVPRYDALYARMTSPACGGIHRA
jgi:hypothetical protein